MGKALSNVGSTRDLQRGGGRCAIHMEFCGGIRRPNSEVALDIKGHSIGIIRFGNTRDPESGLREEIIILPVSGSAITVPA